MAVGIKKWREQWQTCQHGRRCWHKQSHGKLESNRNSEQGNQQEYRSHRQEEESTWRHSRSQKEEMAMPLCTGSRDLGGVLCFAVCA